MVFNIKYKELLEKGIGLVQLVAYTISFLLIGFNIIKSVIFYIIHFRNNQLAFDEVRFTLAESCELALSFILCVEILKLFFINTYKQLIIIFALFIIKIFISYFLEIELNEIKKRGKNINNNNNNNNNKILFI